MNNSRKNHTVAKDMFTSVENSGTLQSSVNERRDQMCYVTFSTFEQAQKFAADAVATGKIKPLITKTWDNGWLVKMWDVTQ